MSFVGWSVNQLRANLRTLSAGTPFKNARTQGKVDKSTLSIHPYSAIQPARPRMALPKSATGAASIHSALMIIPPFSFRATFMQSHHSSSAALFSSAVLLEKSIALYALALVSFHSFPCPLLSPLGAGGPLL